MIIAAALPGLAYGAWSRAAVTIFFLRLRRGFAGRGLACANEAASEKSAGVKLARGAPNSFHARKTCAAFSGFHAEQHNLCLGFGLGVSDGLTELIEAHLKDVNLAGRRDEFAEGTVQHHDVEVFVNVQGDAQNPLRRNTEQRPVLPAQRPPRQHLDHGEYHGLYQYGAYLQHPLLLPGAGDERGGGFGQYACRCLHGSLRFRRLETAEGGFEGIALRTLRDAKQRLELGSRGLVTA